MKRRDRLAIWWMARDAADQIAIRTVIFVIVVGAVAYAGFRLMPETMGMILGGVAIFGVVAQLVLPFAMAATRRRQREKETAEQIERQRQEAGA